MIIFKKSSDENHCGKGEWRLHKFIDDMVIVIIGCPVCGSEGSVQAHTIADDGTVSPSIVCMSRKCSGNGLTDGSAFHDFGKLDDWLPIKNRFKPQ